MSISTVPPLVIDPAAGIREIPTVPNGMSPDIRLFTTGRDAKGRFARWDAVRVTVTKHGHWYRTGDVPNRDNDTVCRGCGYSGHYDYILDYQRCTRPATAEDVQAALSGPARHVQPGDRVRFIMSEYPDPVVGTIRSIYRNVIGQEVAEIDLPSGRDFLQNLEFLTVA